MSQYNVYVTQLDTLCFKECWDTKLDISSCRTFFISPLAKYHVLLLTLRKPRSQGLSSCRSPKAREESGREGERTWERG